MASVLCAGCRSQQPASTTHLLPIIDSQTIAYFITKSNLAFEPECAKILHPAHPKFAPYLNPAPLLTLTVDSVQIIDISIEFGQSLQRYNTFPPGQ